VSDPTYEQSLPDSYPTPLRGPWGRAWGAAHGSAMDALLAAAKAAVKLGFIVGAGPDTFPYHLADTGLEGLPGESPASVVERVRTAFDLWKFAGTRPGIELALSQLAVTGYTLRTTRDWLPDAPPDGRSDLWARYWCSRSRTRGAPTAPGVTQAPGTMAAPGTATRPSPR